MNKVKLEVVKINEDVIATSGNVCEHADNNHIIVTSINNQWQQANYDIYNYDNGKFVYGGPASTLKTNFKTEPEVDKWYYYNGAEAKYYKCDENCEHPMSDDK